MNSLGFMNLSFIFARTYLHATCLSSSDCEAPEWKIHNLRLIPRKFKSRVILLGVASAGAVIFFYLMGALAIQSLLVVWNIAIVLGIIIWEKEKLQNYKMNATSFSRDEKWAGIEKDIRWTEDQLKDTYSRERRLALQSKLRALRSEKRKLEWKIKEESLNALYNTQNRPLKELDKLPKYANLPQKATVADRDELREKTEKLDRKFLDELLKSAGAILKEEPGPSLGNALGAICNDIKAHYNEIKKRDIYASSLCDYWVAMMIIQSVISGYVPDRKLLKYATKGYSSHFKQILKRAGSRVRKLGGASAEGIPPSEDVDAISPPLDRDSDWPDET